MALNLCRARESRWKSTSLFIIHWFSVGLCWLGDNWPEGNEACQNWSSINVKGSSFDNWWGTPDQEALRRVNEDRQNTELNLANETSMDWPCFETWWTFKLLKAEWEVNQQEGEEEFKCYTIWQMMVALLYWRGQLRTERDGETEKGCQKPAVQQKTTDDDGEPVKQKTETVIGVVVNDKWVCVVDLLTVYCCVFFM